MTSSAISLISSILVYPLPHRHIFLQLDLRVGPCPTFTRGIREAHPEQMMLLPVVNHEMGFGWAFGRVHWHCWVKLDDHSFSPSA